MSICECACGCGAEKNAAKPTGLNPRVPFYLIVPVANVDGTIDDIDADGRGTAKDLEAAIQQATEAIEEYKGAMFIYYCKPVTRVTCGAVTVEWLDLSCMPALQEPTK